MRVSICAIDLKVNAGALPVGEIISIAIKHAAVIHTRAHTLDDVLATVVEGHGLRNTEGPQRSVGAVEGVDEQGCLESVLGLAGALLNELDCCTREETYRRSMLNGVIRLKHYLDEPSMQFILRYHR